MHHTTQGKNKAEYGRSELALGRCLVDGDPEAASLARRARRKTFGVSLAIEILLLVLLVAAPLVSSIAQPQLYRVLPPQLIFSTGWRQHNPAQPVMSTTITRSPLIPNPFQPIAPPGKIVGTRPIEEPGEFPVPDILGDYPSGAIQVIEIGKAPLLVEPPHITQTAPQEKRPVKFSEGVQEAQLISRVEPQYPIIAKQTRTEGTVRLRAIISGDGRITSLDVISGHPFLVKAALDAVRQWRYRPTLLNGEPVEVETSITVIFRLHE
jgi:TonB family protein